MTETARDDAQDGFLFRGDVLALDLVNTEIVVRRKAHDLLETPHELIRWWAVVRERYRDIISAPPEQTATPELLMATKQLRAALRRVCTAVAHGLQSEPDDRASINAVLGMARIALTVTSNGTLQQTYTLEPNGNMMLFEIARSAVHLLSECNSARLHTCRNERCVLLFYDTTKSGTRQWCSLDCFNRTRSSENYRRRKAAAQKQK